MSRLLTRHPVTAWYWSHDVHAVIYQPSERYTGLLARSAGHGGSPVPRSRRVTGLPAGRAIQGVTWRQFPSSAINPPGVVLDGPNPYMPGRADRYGPHGYVTLTLSGGRMTERYHLPDGAEIYANDI